MIAEIETEDYSLPAGWESSPLGKLADEERGITYGIVQPGQNTTDGVPIIRVQNIVDGTLDTSDVMRVAPEIAAKYRRTCLRGGELLLSLVGSVGSSVIAPPEVAGWNTARAVAVVPLLPGVDARYIRFCLRSAPIQHWMEVWCNTTVQATLNLSDVVRIPIPIPPKREREAIVEILAALDDKIELNRRMNRTLEELAAALFCSWFVDFDPVVAKAAGRKPAHIRPDLAALFPATFQDSELGDIPNGWQVMAVSEICENIFSGGTPHTQTPEFWNGDLSWLSSGETRDAFIVSTEKTITKAGVDNSSTRLARKGATVIAGAGQGHTRGQTSLLLLDSYINQSVVVLVADEKVSSDSFVYFDLARRYEEFRQLSDAHSSRGSLTTKLVGIVKAVVPPIELVAKFDAVVGPMVAQIEANLRESRTLAALRDTLLPKLLSGELRVKQAEKLVEEVAA